MPSWSWQQDRTLNKPMNLNGRPPQAGWCVWFHKALSVFTFSPCGLCCVCFTSFTCLWSGLPLLLRESYFSLSASGSGKSFWVCSSEQQMLLLTPPGNPWYCKQRQRKSPSLCPSQDPQQPFYSPWKPRVGSAAINSSKCGIVSIWKVFLKQRKYQLKKTEDKVTHNPFILVNYMVKVSQT